MSKKIEVRLPDIGDFDKVDVVEVLVAVGDRVAVEDSLVTLESDKASMDVPSPEAGTVRELKVSPGDSVSMDSVLLLLEVEESADPVTPSEPPADEPATPSAEPEAPSSGTAPAQAAPSTAAAPAATATTPDLGDADVVAEVLVLGSGPGGYTAAFRAADLGKKVVMVERYASLGGVCLNVGCIPSKALLHVAKVIDEAAASSHHGVTFQSPEIDVDKIREWKDGVVGRLTGGIATMAKQRKVEVVTGTGRLIGPHRLEVETADGRVTVGFEQAILAAGSRITRIPGLPYDDPRLIDSTSALELADVPERLLVIGGGIIGLEMATVYHALGSKITVVELFDRLIPGADRDIVRPLHRWIGKRYENIFLKSKVTRVEARDEGLEAFFEGEAKGLPESAVFDKVLLAVGRRPNGHEIGAEAAGVTVDERGFVPVDHQMRTNVPHIFAIGDLAGQPMLAHKAVHEGKVAAEVAAGEKSAFDAKVIPSVAYTDPEVAWVGLTEEEAKAQGIKVGKGRFPWAASGRSLSIGRDEGVTKILFDPETERVVGGAIVGPQAGDLIAEIGLAIEMGADARDLGLTIHPHPTLSETVGLSAEAFEGTITDLYMPKRKPRG